MVGSEAVVFDAAAAYPEVSALRAALAARDWAAVREVLDALPPTGRTMLIRLGGEVDGAEDLLREVLDDDPADAAAAAMLGTRLIDIGWRIRSTARAQYVSNDHFQAFRAWLCQAEAVLIEGTARNPADPALWTARLTTARGLELGLAETRRRYARVTPDHLPAQMQMLQRLCPKWSGSWELLHPWAREATLAAPPGAVQGWLVAEGHIEHCFDLPAGDRTAYLTGEPVRTEIYEAAGRSVLHPEFGRDHGWVHAASAFAMIFVLLEDTRSAAAMFTMLGDLATEDPWYLLGGDSAEQVRHHRARVLAGADR